MRFAIFTLLLSAGLTAHSQAIYDAHGQYRGYSQTSPSGVTNIYSATGQNIGSSQVDHGQTNYYSPSGTYQGTTTATVATPTPNTIINVPRQVPQAPIMKGW